MGSLTRFRTTAEYEAEQAPVTTEQRYQERQELYSMMATARESLRAGIARLGEAEVDPAISHDELEQLRRTVRDLRLAEVEATRALQEHQEEYGPDENLWGEITAGKAQLELAEQRSAIDYRDGLIRQALATLQGMQALQDRLNEHAKACWRRWPAPTNIGSTVIPAMTDLGRDLGLSQLVHNIKVMLKQ